MGKCVILSLITLILSLNCRAEVNSSDYSVDNDGNIVVSEIVEGINAKKADIYAMAKKYIANAYKETKYKIITDNEESGIIIGSGSYLNFHSQYIIPSTYYLCADFNLRVDAKDGRARISLYVKEYSGQRQNINVTEELSDPIINYPPIKESATERDKLYTKAFPVLIERLKATLEEVEQSISKAVSVSADDNW